MGSCNGVQRHRFRFEKLFHVFSRDHSLRFQRPGLHTADEQAGNHGAIQAELLCQEQRALGNYRPVLCNSCNTSVVTSRTDESVMQPQTHCVANLRLAQFGQKARSRNKGRSSIDPPRRSPAALANPEADVHEAKFFLVSYASK